MGSMGHGILSASFKIYTISWVFLLVVATAQIISRRHDSSLLSRSYWQFLFTKWKVLTFFVSGSFITLIGPYTIDATWDYVDGAFMSLLTFLTAPWAVGSIYRRLVGIDKKTLLFAPVCLWLFSASWSYDIYLFIRDGSYPPTWFSNLILSSILYFSAGLFWSLDWKPEKGVVLSFREVSWPVASKISFLKIIWFAIPFAIIALILTAGFLNIFHL